MAPQADGVIANASGAAVRADLNNQLAALFTNHSGATEPATTYAYQWWADTTANQLKLRSGDNLSWITIQELDGTMLMEDGTVGAPGLAFASDLDTGFYRPADNELGIATGGTNAVYIDDAQQVGIGTTAPAGTLDVGAVSGAITAGDLTVTTGSTTAKVTIGRLSSTSNDSTGFRVRDRIDRDVLTVDAGNFVYSQSGSERFRCDSSGRLLVGTSSAPSGSVSQYAKLSVVGNTSSAANGAYFTIGRGSAGSGFVSGTDIGQIFWTDNAGAEFASIAGAADGTCGSGDYPGRLTFSTTADGASSPTERMIIRQDGTTQIFAVYTATTGAAANVNVDVNGYLTRSTSSIKYKTSVETLEDQYADALLQCRPVWYRSLSEKDNPEWGWWGFIAEEVAEIDPRLVHWKTQEVTFDETGSAVTTDLETPEPEGVQYDRFVPHLLNLIKRQKEQIEAMEARLSALEAQ